MTVGGGINGKRFWQTLTDKKSGKYCVHIFNLKSLGTILVPLRNEFIPTLYCK